MIGLKLSLLTGDQRFPTTGADSLFLIGVGVGGGGEFMGVGGGLLGESGGGDEVVRITLYFYRPQTKFGARYYFQKRVSRIRSTGGVPGLGGCLVPGGRVSGPRGAWSRGGSPDPQPRGKLRGIWSRPTTKGEDEGDLVQAHNQGGI